MIIEAENGEAFTNPEMPLTSSIQKQGVIPYPWRHLDFGTVKLILVLWCPDCETKSLMFKLLCVNFLKSS